MNIKKGTVGKLGNFSVGVRNIVDASAATIAIWNPAMPQEKRNDYNISITVKSGDSVPIGKDFYRIAKITAEEIQFERAPSVIALQENALAIADGGTLELHGYAVEVVSIETAGEKNAAKIEIYSNDYPKNDLKKKNEISQSTVSSGDEITIGEKKHKIIAIHSGKGSSRGVLEISIQ